MKSLKEYISQETFDKLKPLYEKYKAGAQNLSEEIKQFTTVLSEDPMVKDKPDDFKEYLSFYILTCTRDITMGESSDVMPPAGEFKE